MCSHSPVSQLEFVTQTLVDFVGQSQGPFEQKRPKAPPPGRAPKTSAQIENQQSAGARRLSVDPWKLRQAAGDLGGDPRPGSRVEPPTRDSGLSRRRLDRGYALLESSIPAPTRMGPGKVSADAGTSVEKRVEKQDHGAGYRHAEKAGPEPGALDGGGDAEDDPPQGRDRGPVCRTTSAPDGYGRRPSPHCDEKHTPKRQQHPGCNENDPHKADVYPFARSESRVASLPMSRGS